MRRAPLGDLVVNKSPSVTRIYLPPDANCLLSVADDCLRTTNDVNVIVSDKKESISITRPSGEKQGATVANKRLSAALIRIQTDQRELDRQRLASPKLTLRQKARIRADQERADASLPAE